MKKLFLTSGLVLCMACPAFATKDIAPTPNQAGDYPLVESNGQVGSDVATCQYPNTLVSETAPTTFYAKWKAHGYTVNYYGGTAKTAEATNPVAGFFADEGNAEFDANYTVLSNTADDLGTAFAQTGYHFTGWMADNNIVTPTATPLNADHTADGTAFQPGATPLYKVVGNVNMYAQWEPDAHTLTYNSGAFSSPSANATDVQNVTYDTSFTVKSFAEAGFTAAPGYTFKGWSETAQDAVVANNWTGWAPTSSLWYIDGDKTLYAAYTANPYTLTYDCGYSENNKHALPKAGAALASTQQFDIVFASTTISALSPKDVCELNGYHISAANNKWTCIKVDNNGDPVLVDNEEQVVAYTADSGERVVGTWNVASSVKCYVETWTPNTIGLAWDAGVGAAANTTNAGGSTCTYDSTINVAGKPTKPGYDFQGWTTSSTAPQGADYVLFPSNPAPTPGTSVTE